MLQICNHSCCTVGLYSGQNQQGQHQLTCVIKAGFSFTSDGQLKILQDSVAIEETDRFAGEVHQSYLLASSEIVPFKPQIEILLYGSAQVPSNNSVVTEVSLGIHWPNNAVWQKCLRVFGPRDWQRTLIGWLPSKPQLLADPLPISYQYAYGGTGYKLNPIGQGFKQTVLPQIELGPKFISKKADQPIPAGFAPIPSYWNINQDTQMHNIYSAAPADQQFEQPFIGGEDIFLKGLIKNASQISLVLPAIKPRLILQLAQQTQQLTIKCDTVVINTDEQVLYMIWRTGVPWDRNDQRQGFLKIS